MSEMRTLTENADGRIKEIVNETVKEEFPSNPRFQVAISKIQSQNHKLCFVIGGSFAEREMLNISDLDACFLIVDDPEQPYSIKYGEKKTLQRDSGKDRIRNKQ